MASAFACAERLTGFRFTADLLDDHGDWVAVGHHPLHALSAERFWPPDKTNTERQVCSDDRRAQITPNRLFFGEGVLDVRRIFLPGWIGWVQFLVCAIAAARVLALRIAAEVRLDVVREYLDDLSAWQGPLLPSLHCARSCPPRTRADHWGRARASYDFNWSSSEKRGQLLV
jgi:hypothetical protein